MNPLLIRAAWMALLGALAGSAAFIGAVNVHPDLAFEMDREVPARAVSGIYPPEISGNESFAWTSDRAQINVQGVDRRWPWVCTARFRGGRSADHPQPEVSLMLDGQVLASGTATNDYQSIEATIPSRPQRGLRLNLTSSTTFVPGPADPRQLGVQLDRLACTPDAGRVVMPPPRAMVNAALTSAIFAAMFVLFGATVQIAAVATLGLAAVQAVPLSLVLAPYTPYADRSMWLAVWIVMAATAGVLFTQRLRALTSAARFAVAFSAVALFLKLLALLHPSKAIIDALFHAHRLDYVLAGRYFFTQPMPGGVEFPYAISLYVFAAPWAALTRDHVALLRVVVSASEAVAGLLLYWAVVHRWRDEAIGALMVVLFHMLPVSFWVIGNANQTNAFGQQAAVAAMAPLIAWRLGARDWWQVAALSALAALALLAHVSTAALLVGAMTAAAIVSRVVGGKNLTPAARAMLIAVVVSAAASVALYYGRAEFAQAYASVRGTQTAVGTAASMSVVTRTTQAILLSGDAVGWPILALAILGMWRLAAEGLRDRLTLALLGWLLAGGAFFAFGLLVPMAGGQQRYALEFIARAVYATSPAVVILAARGGLWAWRAGPPLRWVAVCMVALSAFTAARLWLAWLR